ncbi:hypothetical protein BsWGS_15288 [Bradybaena similaris]
MTTFLWGPGPWTLYTYDYSPVGDQVLYFITHTTISMWGLYYTYDYSPVEARTESSELLSNPGLYYTHNYSVCGGLDFIKHTITPLWGSRLYYAYNYSPVGWFLDFITHKITTQWRPGLYYTQDYTPMGTWTLLHTGLHLCGGLVFITHRITPMGAWPLLHIGLHPCGGLDFITHRITPLWGRNLDYAPVPLPEHHER